MQTLLEWLGRPGAAIFGLGFLSGGLAVALGFVYRAGQRGSGRPGGHRLR
jgi:hypothetical protein